MEKKILSLLLTAGLVLSMLSVGVMANGTEPITPESAVSEESSDEIVIEGDPLVEKNYEDESTASSEEESLSSEESSLAPEESLSSEESSEESSESSSEESSTPAEDEVLAESEAAANKTRATIVGNTASVSPEDTIADIQAAVANSDVTTVNFAAGTYSGLTLNVSGSKSFVSDGAVIFDGGLPGRPGINITGSSELAFTGNFTITNYSDGIISTAGNINFVLNISENSTLHLDGNSTDEQNHGNGLWFSGVGSSMTVNAGSGSTFTASGNKIAGANIVGSSTTVFNFNGCALVQMDRNINSSAIHGGMDVGANIDVNITNCPTVSMSGNGWDGINFSANAADHLNISNSTVTMNNNNGWGINGGDEVNVTNGSVFDISHNAYQTDSGTQSASVYATCSNLYTTGNLLISDSTVTADDAGCAYGIWTYGDCTIINSTVQANGNGTENFGKILGSRTAQGGHGLYIYGDLNISGSTITTNNNTRSGIFTIALKSVASAEHNNVISGSTITANGNGNESGVGSYRNYGIYFFTEADANYYGAYAEISSTDITTTGNYFSGIYFGHGGTVTGGSITSTGNAVAGVTNSVLSNADISGKKTTEYDGVVMRLGGTYNGISLYQGDANSVFTGNGVAAMTAENLELYTQSRFPTQYTYVLSGSLQGNLLNMTGTYGFNSVKAEDESYAAPINENGTKLVRFDLHNTVNTVLSEASNSFTVWDPNGSNYEYSFRYNTAGEDLTDGASGNAYIWTPATVISYDATEGSASENGTAAAGDVSLLTTRGENMELLNTPVSEAEDSYIDLTDYTVCGQSLALSEGTLPEAERENYIFLGWYYPEDSNIARAAEYAASGDYEALYPLLTNSFDERTLTSDMGNDLNGVTVYAMWQEVIAPTESPAESPSPSPSDEPSPIPSEEPTITPTPSDEPVVVDPTEKPHDGATATPSPSTAPTEKPHESASATPTPTPAANNVQTGDNMLPIFLAVGILAVSGASLILLRVFRKKGKRYR